MADINGNKTGGRRKGTVNKRTAMLAPITTVLAGQGFDPLKELHFIFQTTEDEGLRATICMRLIEFIYPKKKAIEIKLEDLPDQELMAEIKRRVDQRAIQVVPEP
jgi:hypothetical protein